MMIELNLRLNRTTNMLALLLFVELIKKIKKQAQAYILFLRLEEEILGKELFNLHIHMPKNS